MSDYEIISSYINTVILIIITTLNLSFLVLTEIFYITIKANFELRRLISN